MSEVYTAISGATATVAHDTSLSNVFLHSSPVSDFVANFTNVPVTDLRSRVVTLIIQQGSSPYVPISIQIAGVSQTVRWIGGTTVVGIANQVTIVTFSLIRTGSTWLVIGNYSSYN